MRVPASKILDYLVPGLLINVRREDYGGYNADMTYTDAVSAAIRGEVEGIVTKSGRLRYLHLLPPEQRVPAPELKAAEVSDDGGSTAFARTNLGVYREAVREAFVIQDPWGGRTTKASGEIVGHIYQHCALRGRHTARLAQPASGQASA